MNPYISMNNKSIKTQSHNHKPFTLLCCTDKNSQNICYQQSEYYQEQQNNLKPEQNDKKNELSPCSNIKIPFQSQLTSGKCINCGQYHPQLSGIGKFKPNKPTVHLLNRTLKYKYKEFIQKNQSFQKSYKKGKKKDGEQKLIMKKQGGNQIKVNKGKVQSIEWKTKSNPVSDTSGLFPKSAVSNLSQLQISSIITSTKKGQKGIGSEGHEEQSLWQLTKGWLQKQDRQKDSKDRQRVKQVQLWRQVQKQYQRLSRASQIQQIPNNNKQNSYSLNLPISDHFISSSKKIKNTTRKELLAIIKKQKQQIKQILAKSKGPSVSITISSPGSSFKMISKDKSSDYHNSNSVNHLQKVKSEYFYRHFENEGQNFNYHKNQEVSDFEILQPLKKNALESHQSSSKPSSKPESHRITFRQNLYSHKQILAQPIKTQQITDIPTPSPIHIITYKPSSSQTKNIYSNVLLNNQNRSSYIRNNQDLTHSQSDNESDDSLPSVSQELINGAKEFINQFQYTEQNQERNNQEDQKFSQKSFNDKLSTIHKQNIESKYERNIQQSDRNNIISINKSSNYSLLNSFNDNRCCGFQFLQKLENENEQNQLRFEKQPSNQTYIEIYQNKWKK